MKVQNENSGKSSWWTVNLDAKSGRTSRRRSHSVDNSNTPSPKLKKKRERSKLKKVNKGAHSPGVCSSPCDSPTATCPPLLQPPWSPNPSVPSPTGSDLSPCYSPVLQRSRNATPVSPLVSPPAIDQQNGSLFSGSNSSLLESTEQQMPQHDIAEPPLPLDISSLNLHSSREGMGSSSSLSSINSPRPQPSLGSGKSPHPVFTFQLPFADSSGYSSSTCFSDTDASLPQEFNSYPQPPSYEEHLVHSPSIRSSCYTPTRTHTHHQLHQCLQADAISRPRSTSEPAHVNRLPPDLDMELFNHGFDCDMDSIIQNEMQYENGELDFQFEQQQHHLVPSDPTLTSVAVPVPTQVRPVNNLL